MNKYWLCLSLVSAVSIGCAATPADVDGDSTDSSDEGVTNAEAASMLDLVNDPAVDVGLLDVDVGLDARAAKNIIAHRRGADGVYPSADDDSFDNLNELSAIAYVGKSAFEHIRAYAVAHPSPKAVTVEGVKFLGWQAAAVVWGVDHATVAELDNEVALDARAAKNLVASAPHASVGAMGPVAYVGSTALALLRDFALTWYEAMPKGDTCEVNVTQANQPAVAAYSQGVDDYDYSESWAGYSLSAWNAPTCLDLGDADQLHALQGVLIDFSDWTYVLQDAPEALIYGDVVPGAVPFLSQLEESLARMDDMRSMHLADGEPDAQARYDMLKNDYDKIVTLANAHPGQMYSFWIHFDAEECSQDSALMIDLATGLAVGIHRGPGC